MAEILKKEGLNEDIYCLAIQNSESENKGKKSQILSSGKTWDLLTVQHNICMPLTLDLSKREK